jgi:hypothetical protein
MMVEALVEKAILPLVVLVEVLLSRPLSDLDPHLILLDQRQLNQTNVACC